MLIALKPQRDSGKNEKRQDIDTSIISKQVLGSGKPTGLKGEGVLLVLVALLSLRIFCLESIVVHVTVVEMWGVVLLVGRY